MREPKMQRSELKMQRLEIQIEQQMQRLPIIQKREPKMQRSELKPRMQSKNESTIKQKIRFAESEGELTEEEKNKREQILKQKQSEELLLKPYLLQQFPNMFEDDEEKSSSSISSTGFDADEDIEEIQTYSTKQELLQLLIKSQQSSGEFNNIETFIPQLISFNYQGYPKNIIQSIFVILLIEIHFNDTMKLKKEIIQKTNNWLSKQNISVPIKIKDELKTIIKTMTFK